MKSNNGSVNVPGLRWRLPFALLVSALISFLDRMNISFALPQMAKDYGWTTEQIGSYGGLALGIFWIGYGLAQIFFSPIGEKYGPRKSIIVVVILFSIFTVLQAPFGLIFVGLIIVRICLGLSEGIHVPMMNMLTKRWFPLNERSRANALWTVGMLLAMVVAPFVVVPITDIWGWRAMFIILGIAGMIITLPLMHTFVYDTPGEDPRMSREEIQFIESGSELDEPDEEDLWKGIKLFLRRKAYWFCILSGISSNMAIYGVLSWLPTYFVKEKGLNFMDLTWAASIPYGFAILGVLLWSYLGDKTNRRALLSSISFLLAGIMLWFAASADSITMVLILFSLTVFIEVSYIANEYAIVQRILPRSHVATGIGFYNGAGTLIGGGLGPVVVGGVVAATGSYTTGLLSITAVCGFGALVVFILSRFLKY